MNRMRSYRRPQTRGLVAWVLAAAVAASLFPFAPLAGVAGKDVGGGIPGMLRIAPPGRPARSLGLEEALHFLHMPSVGIALVDGGRVAWSRTFSREQAVRPVYQ